MYLKFCRSYGEEEKDKDKLSSPLSVDLTGESGKQGEGKTPLYRAGCLLLGLLCLILLLVVVILSMKLQSRTEAPVPVHNEPCNWDQCKADFPGDQRLQRPECRLCEHNWLEFGKSCFFLSPYRMTWDQSQRNCSSRGGSLAIITNRALQQHLTKAGVVAQGTRFWIGLRKFGDEWRWVNNHTLQESYWTTDVPGNECGILDAQSGRERNWDMGSCRAATYFICQLHLR